MTLFNPILKTLTPYIAGKSIEELGRESKLKSSSIVKLASNENPLGPSPQAMAAIKNELKKINRYPDSYYYNLREKLSRNLNLDINNICLGNGSDELIDCVIKSFSSPGDEVLSAKTTFLEYKIITKVNSRKFKAVSLKGFRYDLEAISGAISKKTKLIFIANPNNPTGTYVSRKEVKEFLKKIPRRVIVIFDEAYNEFIDVGDFPDSRKYFKDYNVISLRTFSKIYGLAGLRIGFAVSSPKFINVMNKVRQPFNVNSLAQVAASAAIRDKQFLKRSKETIWREKQYLYKNLRQLGISFIPSVANFILFDVKENCQRIFAQLLKRGVIVRPMGAYGLKNFIRVTIGTHRENVKFIREIRRVK